MPLAQTLLANLTGAPDPRPGEHVETGLDLIYLHEALGKVIPQFEELERHGAVIKQKERVVVVLDHWVPAPSVDSAINHRRIRQFVNRVGIEHFFDVGRSGICHQLLAEEGFVHPGNMVVGSDSHTPTLGALGAFAMGVGPTDIIGALVTGRIWLEVPGSIGVRVDCALTPPIAPKDLALHVIGTMGLDGAEGKALEYFGEGVREMSMAGRFTLANMSVECGAVTCLMASDPTTGRYLKRRARGHYFISSIEPSGDFDRSLDIAAGDLVPMVAIPPDPATVKPVGDIAGIEVDQVYIGSCTNGRLEDLAIVADILKGKVVHPRTRLIVSPASQEVYLQAMQKGLIAGLVRAGAVILSPGCNACFGGHQGILAEGDVCLSTTNRNFAGRMGAAGADIYLASPATAAATAIRGRITDPNDV